MQNQAEQWLLGEKYRGERCAAFFTDLTLLKTGTPLAYLIGSIPFLDCVIYLDSYPLIPRTETEFWTEKAINQIKNSHGKGQTPVKVLDLCAGSGAIGVAVAKTISEVLVDFAEIDPLHLPTIKKNIEENLSKPFDRLKGLESDLFKKIPTKNKYDFILTNPPYIDPSLDRTEESVKLNEPDLALYGGVAGMECIKKIIAQASCYLTNTGQLWIEHEPEQVEAIVTLAHKNGYMVQTHLDQYDTYRYSVLTHTVSQ